MSQYSRNPARLAEIGYPGARAALKDGAIHDIPVVVNDDSPNLGQYIKNISFQIRRRGPKLTKDLIPIICKSE
jgi:hypothetical protein